MEITGLSAHSRRSLVKKTSTTFELNADKSHLKAAFHDTYSDTNILAEILARIVVRMSACRATSQFSLPQ